MWLAVVGLGASSCACSAREVPAGALIVDRVDVLGAEKVDDEQLKERIATAETSHALGGLLAAMPILSYVDALTVEYRTFDRLVLDRDLERVRRWYRARGFYDAEVRAGRVVETEEGHVRIEIVVVEGEPVSIEKVTLSFPDWQRAFRANAALVDMVSAYQVSPIEELETAPRFDEDRYDDLKRRLRRTLANHGYAYAKVEGKVAVDVAKHTATVSLEAEAGPFCHIAEVTFEGLGEIPEKPIRRALGIKKGDAFSAEKIEQANYALSDFQVFGSVEIAPQLSKEGEPVRTQIPIVVRVQPIRLRGVKAGLGAELGAFLDVHGLLGWEDRNLLGGLRTLSAEIDPALVFFPLGADTLTDPPSQIVVVPEAALEVRFTQPGFPEARTNTFVTGKASFHVPRTFTELKVFPEPAEGMEADPDGPFGVLVYRELEGVVGLERKFRFPYLGGFSFSGSPLVKVQFESPAVFGLDAPLPFGFDNVLIPYLELNGALDFRRSRTGELDAKDPTSGAYLDLSAQFAALGDAEDVRLRPELRLYAPLGPDVVFAARWTTGFLFPFNYDDAPDPGSMPTLDEQRAINRDLQLLSFRAFRSGGSASNRGYAFGQVGPHEALYDLSSRSVSSQLLPSGGRGMWEISAELRFPLVESFLGVVFVDASDVVRTLGDFRVTHPHISPGVGLRYVSPVGRIRLDLGVRPPYLQEVGVKNLSPEEGGPAPGEDAGIPLAFHIGIGEAI